MRAVSFEPDIGKALRVPSEITYGPAALHCL